MFCGDLGVFPVTTLDGCTIASGEAGKDGASSLPDAGRISLGLKILLGMLSSRPGGSSGQGAEAAHLAGATDVGAHAREPAQNA